MRLLTLLADAVFPPRESELLIRDLSYEDLADTLSAVCRGEGAHAVMGLGTYGHPYLEACIVEAKFHANMRAAELLGYALGEFLYELLAESAALCALPPCIVPLPLSAARLKERGYNQVERIVEHSIRTGFRAEVDSSLLVRTRQTVPQTSLSGAERRRNVAGAFAVTAPCNSERTYIVVDDVITTGNTMQSACDALRAGGARCLLPLTLAY